MKTPFKVVIIIMLTFLTFCTNNSSKSSIDLSIKLLHKYGKIEGDENEVIGAIGRFTVDQFENLYLIDKAFKHVKKFNKNGSVIRIFGNGEGQGPGEFIAPHDVDVDSVGNIYITDRSLYNITIFDSINNLIKTIKTNFMPAQIVTISPFKTYVTGFLFSLENHIIKKYNFYSEKYDKPILSFCNLNSCKDSLAIVRSGNTGNLVKDSKKNLYYSFFYPYEIRQYTLNGEIISTIRRNDEDFKPPYFKNDMVLFTTGSKGLIILPNGIIANLVLKIKNEKFNYQLDFFQVSRNMFLGSVSLDEFGIDNVLYIESDPNGNIYIATSVPYPQILKYKLTLEM
jgi:hypothetical protein